MADTPKLILTGENKDSLLTAGPKLNQLIDLANGHNSAIGDTAGLQTTEKGSLVGAINETTTQLAETNQYAKVPNLHHDFSNKPNGAINSVDTNQPFRIYNNPSSSSGLAISGGAMVHGAPSANNAAGYLEVKLPNKITRIGAKFKYSDITYGGSVTVASFASSIVEAVVDNGQPIPNAGIHVTLNPSYIGVTIYQSTGTIQLGDIPISGLQANTEYSFEVIVDRENSTLYVVKPDGTLSKGFKDSRIASMSSEYATFELYEVDTTKIPAVMTSVWADDKTYSKDGSNLTTLDIFKAMATNYNSVDQSGYVTLVTDANSADKSGFYYTNTNTPNTPTTDSYFLFTQKANNLYAVQYAYRLNADLVFRRALRNGTWGAWIQVPQAKEVSSDDNGHGVVITDADNVAMSGYYQSSGTVANAPTTSGGYVYHVISASSQYKIMYAWNLSTGVRYRRSMSAGTWGAWVTVTE